MFFSIPDAHAPQAAELARGKGLDFLTVSEAGTGVTMFFFLSYERDRRFQAELHNAGIPFEGRQDISGPGAELIRQAQDVISV